MDTGTVPHIRMRPPETAPAAIETARVDFAYGPDPVLKEFSISVPAASFIGVAGANGSGKTTLLKLLSGVLRPDAGTVRIFGRDMAVHPRRDAARTVAFVPQSESAVFPYPVRSFVMFGRHPHNSGPGFDREEDRRIVEDAMRLVEITHLAGRPVTELSGGELHRASIARALAQATPVILLDEPNAHLDIRHQLALFDLLSHLSQACGRTVVCVTHDLNLAATYCDRIALLHDGRLVAYDAPPAVLTSEHVRRCFGIDADITIDETLVRVHGRRGMSRLPDVVSDVFLPLHP